MSVEQFNQHAAISDLQHTEELLLDQHRAMIDCLENYYPELVQLFALANNVDYDQDGEFKFFLLYDP